MPFEWNEDGDGLLIITATDDVNLNDVFALRNELNRFRPQRQAALLDVARANTSSITPAAIRAFGADHAAEGKLAIVTGDATHEYGRARMFQNVAELYRPKSAVCVFQDREQALNWLKGGDGGDPFRECRTP